MSLRSQLIHTCTIERDLSPPRDSFGGEAPAYTDLHTDLACRLMAETAQVNKADDLSLQMETLWKMIVPAGTDIVTKDRVKLVTLEDKSTDGPFDITAVIPRRDGKGQRLVALSLEVIE